jgi:putative endopeptidase
MTRVPLLRLLAPLTLLSTTLAAQAAPTPDLDTAGMDRNVKPGDAFFEYANGSWLRRTDIPADRSTYGASAMLIEQTDRKVADLIRDPANAQAPAGSDLRRVADYYAAFLDTAAIEAAGLTPLSPRWTPSRPSGTATGSPGSSAPPCAPTSTR